MEQPQKIDTRIINAKSFFIFMLICMGTGTFLTMLIAMTFRHFAIIIIGIFIFSICPTLIFQKKLRKLFTRRAEVIFCKGSFTVKFYNRKTDELERKDENIFDEIKSFKAINSTKDDSSFLKLVFKNEKSVVYTFLEQQSDGDKMTNIIELVNIRIRAFNAEESESFKIALSPNLFASKAGTYYIAVLTALLTIVFTLQIVYKPKTIPITLFAGAFLYLQIIAQRKRDVTDLENFNKK